MTLKVAVTTAPVLLAGTLHVLVPTQHALVAVQEPDQPLKVDEAAGLAVKVTELRPSNLWKQRVPHWIPAGTLVTVPDPVPFFETLTASPQGWPHAGT